MKILILNGPNLNLLGKREVNIYGNQSFESYFEELKIQFPTLNLSQKQSNQEGVLIDILHQFGFDDVDPEAEHVRDYAIWRQTARSEGYFARLADHERRTSVEVVPY